MSKKVLIAYGSRYGSTEEISQEIAKVLENQGLEVQIVDLKKTKSKDWPPIEPFDGVLVGSGIRIMKWVREPQEFLSKHKGEFPKKKLGIFISSGFASIPGNREKAKQDWIEKVMEKVGVKADLYDAFGGVFDFSQSSRMGGLDKRMLKMAAKGMSKEFDMKIDEKGRNDFRDWNQIRSFAEKFAKLVKS